MNDIIKWKKLFIKFLKKEKVLGQYIKNTELAKIFDSEEMTRLIRQNQPTQFINLSFTWSDTNEGHTFWSQLHSKWIDFIRYCESDDKNKKKKRDYNSYISYFNDFDFLT